MGEVLNIKRNKSKVIRDNIAQALDIADRKDLYELLSLATDKQLISISETVDRNKETRIRGFERANKELNKFMAEFTGEFGITASTLVYDYLLDASKSMFDIKGEVEAEMEARLVQDLINRLALYEMTDLIVNTVENKLVKKCTES